MPEGPASVTKVISSTLKKLRYGGKSKSRKELESGKMEPGKVIQRQEIELQRCWEGKLVFLLHNVFTEKASVDFAHKATISHKTISHYSVKEVNVVIFCFSLYLKPTILSFLKLIMIV